MNHPAAFTQIVKAGRGWLITRNSATLASTDYKHIAQEIADALNERMLNRALAEQSQGSSE